MYAVYAMASSESFFFGTFSIFESGDITKHLMTGPSGNSEFCFPSNKTHCFPCGQSLSAYIIISIDFRLIIIKSSYQANASVYSCNMPEGKSRIRREIVHSLT